MKRYDIERSEKWSEFAETIPAIQFKPEWFVQVVPPFAGAMVRFRVYLTPETGKGARFVSVYLDAYDVLGCVGHPYWEIYPIDGDCARFDMADVDGLVQGITESLAEERDPMTPAERTAKVAELRAEADRLEREGKRNWPERVEKGMMFAWGSIKYILSPTANLDEFVLVNLEDGNRHANPSKDPFYYGTVNYTYLGHARDLLTIKAPGAHEPTGAELVGKVCEFSDDGEKWFGRDECSRFDASDSEMTYRSTNIIGDTGKNRTWFRHARLYREDRP